MPKFHVRSGALNVTIIADDPHAAAIELVESQNDASASNAGPWSFRRNLAEQILVSPCDERRSPERFITFDSVAHLNRQTRGTAWRRAVASLHANQN